MCKTYDAIIELSKYMKSNILILSVGKLKIEGELYACEDERCYKDIITLKDAKIGCFKTDETKHFKWMNIPSAHISAFAFKCCEEN